MERSKADSFTAFLLEKRRLESMRQTPLPGASPLTLLQILAEVPDREMPVGDLQAATGMSFTVFAESLNGLRESGVLDIKRPTRR